MDIEQQKEDFKKLTSDINRWAWVFDVNKHQIEQNESKTLTIMLDNDQTILLIGEGETGEHFMFNESIGNMPGIFDLLGVHRIKCEMV